MIELRDTQGMLGVVLHPSLWRGLCDAASLTPEVTNTLTLEEATDLDHWANNVCDNPSGQRADLARSVAGLLRVTGSLQVIQNRSKSGGFWELMAQ
jgi:hypothetical protein